MDGKYHVEKFDEMDFELWKMKIEDCLYGKDLFLPSIEEKALRTKIPNK